METNQIYYRFDHDKPRVGQAVHAWRSLEDMKRFAKMMKSQDPDFRRMKFWKIEGTFFQEDDGDVIVRVIGATEITLSL